MNDEIKRLVRQLPVHKIKITPWEYIRYFPIALASVLWRRLIKKK